MKMTTRKMILFVLITLIVNVISFSPSLKFPRSIRLTLMDSKNACENDKIGVIVVDHGSKKAESNMLLLKLVEQYKQKSKFRIVEAAHMELSEPSIATAFTKCVKQGAKTIICHPYFLSIGRHVQEDIPALVEDIAKHYPDISYRITPPLGLQHDTIIELIENTVEQSVSSMDEK